MHSPLLSAYDHHSDAYLLQLLANEDAQAFEAIYSRYWALLYQSAFYIVEDRDAASDLVQDVFVWLWNHRHTLNVQNLKAYLKAAVKFKVANYIRSGRIRDGLLEELARRPQPAPAPGADELLEGQELQRIIREAVGELPQKCREIYLLSREECLSNREIADRLGISTKTVENQMTIALRRLRRVVELHIVFLVITRLLP